ncbi:unnamed protein product [Rotaria sp. Silwood2]|nr:unnamed protein product [Rotaria sp. Silwood2]
MKSSKQDIHRQIRSEFPYKDEQLTQVVIYGKYWGRFNGLQIGFRQPKVEQNLSGIISAYSTDDRYNNDIHYHGGCLAAQEDKYWRHGSISEDYSKILCPVLLIGGFSNLYNSSIFRLINQLECPKRAILGPWRHQWPDDDYPGPQIGFLQELVQWFDYYIKNPKKVSFLSPQETGLSSGNLLGWGIIYSLGHPIDQQEDDGRSLCFESLPLNQDYELFGFPNVKLNLSSNSKNGLICVRLCMIEENSSSSILISRGILNLTLYASHEHSQQLNVDEIYNNIIWCVCVCLPSGCRLRLSLSTSYWPIVWPSSQLSTLTIHFNEISPYILTLPCLNDQYSITRFRMLDEINELITLKINDDNGSIEYPDGLIWNETSESIYEIKKK